MTEEEFERLKNAPMEDVLEHITASAKKMLPGDPEKLREIEEALDGLMGAFQDVFPSSKVAASLKMLADRIRIGAILGLFLQTIGPKSEDQERALESLFRGVAVSDMRSTVLMVLHSLITAGMSGGLRMSPFTEGQEDEDDEEEEEDL